MSEDSFTDEASRLALKYSLLYGGKIEVTPKVPIRDLKDFSIWYTPGVAAVSEAIKSNKELSFEYTCRWNTIAIITDGSRVLGLGDIGPEAAMPVMEGKALIYKYLGGVDAIPLPIDVYKPDNVIEVIKSLQPAFGGINLEDIASPKCFYVMDKLRAEMEIPIWHDDQQGTAGVILASLINSLKLTGRKLRDTKIVFFGVGAANIANAKLIIEAGADPGNFILIDSKGILHLDRGDMDKLLLKHPWKHDLAIKTNREKISGDLTKAFDGSDVLIAASKPDPNVIKKEWISKMNKKAIVFTLANPIPEIWPWKAKEAGAYIVATGRSDFPNQANNSLIFPAVFRGVLDIRAKAITDEMMIAAAEELAKCAEEKGLSRDHIIPTMAEWEVYPKVAARVGEKGVELGLARKRMSKDEIYGKAIEIIRRSRRLLTCLIEAQIIPLQSSKEGVDL
ncbi:MAG: NADP-dependent malic enzyme [Candidatus Methylarchaceae archaeon HK02M2]|nr:NADP-dependent malic enzyme [Candidatus Methylarchaceae archaeon HK02M2]